MEENLFKFRAGWCIENCIQEIERYKRVGRTQPQMIEETYKALEMVYKAFVHEFKLPEQEEEISDLCKYKKLILGELGSPSNFSSRINEVYDNTQHLRENFPILQRIKRNERVEPDEADKLVKYLKSIIDRTMPVQQM